MVLPFAAVYTTPRLIYSGVTRIMSEHSGGLTEMQGVGRVVLIIGLVVFLIGMIGLFVM